MNNRISFLSKLLLATQNPEFAIFKRWTFVSVFPWGPLGARTNTDGIARTNGSRNPRRREPAFRIAIEPTKNTSVKANRVDLES